MKHSKPGICFDFQKGKCRRGAECHFRHDLSLTSAKTVHNDHTKKSDNRQTDDNIADGLHHWIIQTRNDKQLGHGLRTFFQQALHFVKLHDAARQEVIKHLATEGGLQKILELVSKPFETMSELDLVNRSAPPLIPLIRAIGDEHVMSSLLLEHYLGSICQFIYGVGGQRGEKLFAAVIRALSALMHRSDVEFFTFLEASLAVLSKLVEFNSTAKVTPCFTTYANTLAAMLTPQSDPVIDTLRYQASKHLENINKVLGTGDTIRSMHALKVQAGSCSSKPVFNLKRSLPGKLANGRPRHDNDFASIDQIQIMPTSAEIQSTHAEYLPLQDPSTWHKGGIDGLLDRHFRLLREDTVGQLRDSARVELQALQGGEQQHTRHNDSLRRHTYRNVLVEIPKFDSNKGLEFVISFEQPPELKIKSKKQRQDWWAQSKRLDGDALICLISSTNAVVFCSIAYPNDPSKRHIKKKHEEIKDPHENVVSYSEDRVRVIARPSETNAESISHILGTFSSKTFSGGRSLVEFPGVLLPAFLPTLTALKAISKSKNLPFADFLAPTYSSGNETVVIPPPAYAQRAGFRFNLDSITQTAAVSFNPSSLKQKDVEDLKNSSTLDETQASALLHSLSRSFALIQGPPGTGKSYTGVALMKTLVGNKKAAALGPIFVVTYTNHALDQSLEHLLDEGITQIVRLGSGSKSERLKDLNLKQVTQKVDRTRAEKSDYGNTRGQMLNEAHAVSQELERISHATQNLKDYLAAEKPDHFAQLFGRGPSTGEWEVQSKKNRLKNWLKGGKQLQGNGPAQMIAGVADLYSLSYTERRNLYHHWLCMARDSAIDAIVARAEHFDELRARRDAVSNELDFRVLEQADVIGLTTSGLARNLNLLRKLPSKVLLCEEAGEVLESHLLTALLPSIEHAILIGDHLQLRPHVSCFDLSQESARGRQHALDTSLFERLVTAPDGGARLPFSRLDTQRRMHPEIAELVRATLYPTLSDSPSTMEHPQVAGVKQRLFWLDHRHAETRGDMLSTSRTNDYEVEMTTALVSHLLKQGVNKSGTIAVLTPYVGQLRKLQHRMQSAFEVVLDDRDVKMLQDEGLDDAAQSRAPPAPGVQKGSIAQAVRIATVDNFQGEEADIVVVSLVRSNERQKCGFLSTPNRINVLLSRAKNGMYIIGNSATTQHIQMWTEVLELLEKNENLGEVLELSCPRHPTDVMKVSTPDDFTRLAPDGGCSLSCSQRLLCGHACPSSCHSQVLHDAVKCLAPCTRKTGQCEHPCPNICGDRCPPACMQMLNDLAVELSCGHVKKSLPCHLYHNQDQIVCNAIVDRIVPGCSHQASVKCSEDVNDETYQCREECGDLLSCGHTCKSACKDCKNRIDGRIVKRSHARCRQPCGRDFLNCSHRCDKPCHDGTDCGLCDQPCEVSCMHSRCGRKCSEHCAPCAAEKCPSSCPHSGCSMPCGAPCDWIPCSQRCTNLLECGHQCPSVCGEPCPNTRFCQECASEDVKSRVVDLIMLSKYSEIDLDESPCILPDCGHFYTITTMDGHLHLGEHYVLDENDVPIALKTPEDGLDVDKTRIVCPDCRRSLRNIPRYGRVVRRALLIQSTLKFITWSNNDYVRYFESFSRAQKALQASVQQAKQTETNLHLYGSGSQQIHTIRSNLSHLRYEEIIKLRFDINLFRSQVGGREQPFKRVQALVQHARLQQRTEGVFSFDGSVILQTRSHALATSLLMRCDLVILSDVLAIRSKKALSLGIVTLIDFAKNRADCEYLFQISEQGKHHLQQAEALIYWAHFAALEVSWRSAHDEDRASSNLETLRASAKTRLDQARLFCAEHAQAHAIASEIDEIEKMLRESTFYSPVTNEEMQDVVRAMTREFRGTGHWYRCRNGHPFTVGECGGLVTQSTCPQCGEPVGGRDYHAADGVTRAVDLETGMGNLRL